MQGYKILDVNIYLDIWTIFEQIRKNQHGTNLQQILRHHFAKLLQTRFSTYWWTWWPNCWLYCLFHHQNNRWGTNSPEAIFLYFSSLFQEATRWIGWEQGGGLATTGEECRDVTASAPPPSSARQRRPARVGAGHCRHICICAKFATFFLENWMFLVFFLFFRRPTRFIFLKPFSHMNGF